MGELPGKSMLSGLLRKPWTTVVCRRFPTNPWCTSSSNAPLNVCPVIATWWPCDSNAEIHDKASFSEATTSNEKKCVHTVQWARCIFPYADITSITLTAFGNTYRAFRGCLVKLHTPPMLREGAADNDALITKLKCSGEFPKCNCKSWCFL